MAVKKAKSIGEITHYFDEIKVAVIKLGAPLKAGQKIRITGGKETDFEQEIKSMQIDHKLVKSAKRGQEIGIKVNEKVRDGYKVWKI
ncbi:MAG: hypothetical protein A2599_01925 [Candidatus Staskawiczbacteria bacterium RIFOXYD1_FULL_39_28]|uniref:Translation elongation factor-like protein n=1 Tax=Candidatus Staskawiczbacteria bacterium RIFOXYC1_FULL_38_18 TaxID=1802229 RepID=A0A1G2JDT5_9BACT|nr:MAG: hypothetical protein A2401_00955 [Candidatus Staskawiczbacteria bacterium RIFOXYC1_FULL_38_18]OGZ91786.1 MAG: hypothetical protein A2599_01925 [Candidatus Staskawiczbacteria bacterium RIFOXYD1_FULL_39_28]